MNLKDISRVIYKPQFLAVLVVTAVGAFLRFYTLTQTEFWYDEAFSGLLIRENWATMFEIIRADIHPPLYYALLKVWSNVFGYSDFILRVPSALFGALLVPLAWVFTVNLLNNKNSWAPVFVAAFIAINPFLVTYSQEARAYSMLAFLLVLAGNFFYSGITRSPLKFNLSWLGFAVAVSLAFLTHYAAALGIVTFFIFALFYYPASGLIAKKNLLRLLILSVLVTLLPAATYFWWSPTLKAQLPDQANHLHWLPEPELTSIPGSLYAFMFSVDRQELGVPSAHEFVSIKSLPVDSINLLLFAAIIGMTGFAFAARRERAIDSETPSKIPSYLKFSLFVWIFPLILAVFLYEYELNVYLERYLIGYGAFFLIYLALLGFKLNFRVSLGALALYAVVVLGFLPVRENLGYREVIEFLEKDAGATQVVFAGPVEFTVAKYYLAQWGQLERYDDKIRLYDFDRGWDYAWWEFIEETHTLVPPQEFSPSDILVTTYPPEDVSYRELGQFGEFGVYDDLEILGSLP